MEGTYGLLDVDFGPELIKMMSSAKLIPQQAEKRWGVPAQHIQDVMDGKVPPSKDLEDAIMGHSPLDLAHLYSLAARENIPKIEDTLDGVVILHAKESDVTMRPLYRTSDNGVKFEVYKYADTAVSRSSKSLILPERIWESIIVSNDFEKLMPKWAANQGHFEQQMTYFIGDVTTYWINPEGGISAENMTTGDMEYHVPFVPHLFTKRDVDEALIVAITFRGEVGTREFLDLIKGMNETDYMDRVRGTLAEMDTSTLNTGKGGFFVSRYIDALSQVQGRYNVKTLLKGIPFQPDTLGLEYKISKDPVQGEYDINANAERWGYVLGQYPVELGWADHKEILEPNSSFFIQAGVPHYLKSIGGDGKALIMQVQPKQEDPWKTLAMTLYYAGEEGVLRARQETKQWTK